MGRLTKFGFFVAMFACAACVRPAVYAEPESPVQKSAGSKAVDGVWRSDGFGYVMQIENESVRFYHATGHVCVETDNEDLKLTDVFEVYRLMGSDTMFASSTTEPFEFKFHRIAQIPSICLADTPTTFADTIEALNSFLVEHYVFFEARGLDRAQIIADLSEASFQVDSDMALFNAITRLLSQTHDAHVELYTTIDGEPLRFDADPGMIRRLITLRAAKNGTSEKAERQVFLQELWVEGIGENILGGDATSAANDRIRYGIIEGNIGYIALRSMGGFVSEDSSDGDTEAEVLTNTMDRAIDAFDEVRARAVILDVSINSGGYEYLSRQLAGRFADKRRMAYQVYAGDAQDQSPQPMFIEPEGRSQFIGPVYLLTSSETVSAAEALTMAMRAIPEVTHVGAPTRGALSTKLAKLLPNGWELTLSNQVVLDHEGLVWEANPALPHVPIEVFAGRDISDEALLDVDFAAAHQSAVAEIIAHVRNTLNAD